MKVWVSLSAVLGLCILSGGCGGGGNDGPVISMESGLQQIRAEVPNNSPALAFELQGGLTQNGSSISGIMHFMNSSCFPFSTDISLTGTATASEIDLQSVLPNGQQVVFTQLTHPGGHGSFLGGNYAVTGAGCIPTAPGSVVVQVEALGGNWIGTLNSSSGSMARINLNMSQTGPDAHGLFSANGTATITGGTCFGSANIDPSTVLIGDGSTLVLDDAAPPGTGKTVLTGNFFGPSPVGFGAGSGTYISSEGSCSETGTFSLSQ
ncbi:MAG TPA: hypothetical protein VJV96_20780 [Candidatus Angelobacter sp.]|nr:hypothetical protein [Candidatus Angelobacter sp.]